MLSSNPTSVPEPNLEPTVSSLDATMMSSSSRDSSYTRAETVLVSKTGDSSVQKRIKKRKKVKQQSLDASVLGTDDCSNCDVCDYEKRLSQMSLQNPTDEFDKLQQYMIDTGGKLSYPYLATALNSVISLFFAGCSVLCSKIDSLKSEKQIFKQSGNTRVQRRFRRF